MSVEAGANTVPPKTPLSPSLANKIAFGSGHHATVKSLALLHELQDYLSEIQKSSKGTNEELEVSVVL